MSSVRFGIYLKVTEASANMSFKRLHEQEKHYDIVAYKKAVPDNRNGSFGGDLSLADAVSCIRLFRNFAPIVIGAAASNRSLCLHINKNTVTQHHLPGQPETARLWDKGGFEPRVRRQTARIQYASLSVIRKAIVK